MVATPRLNSPPDLALAALGDPMTQRNQLQSNNVHTRMALSHPVPYLIHQLYHVDIYLVSSFCHGVPDLQTPGVVVDYFLQAILIY